jgi:hypothetical protein
VISQVERLARVEVEVQALKSEVDELKTSIKEMHVKLDDLLALRYKGVGAFWLASALIGTGVVGAIAQILHYIGVK